MKILLILALLAAPLGAQFRAGVARVKITPTLPAWLSGFAARTRPAETIAQDLWAKALAIEDAQGNRVVLVTADLIGFTREVTDEIATRALAKYKLERRQVIFNASHTHSGPSIWPRLHVARSPGLEVTPEMKAYADKLIEDVSALIGRALESMQPARLETAEGQANFGSNRRVVHLAAVRPGERFPAPSDPSVPVLRVTRMNGQPLAIVVGYACHNTVLTAEFVEVSGDYAGHAQIALEDKYPGVQAMFVALCGADQGAAVRSKRELAKQYGETLAQAAIGALVSKATPVSGGIRTAYEVTSLPFQAHTRETYAAESQSTDPFLARRGRLMLQALEAKRPVLSTPYPVQAVRFGGGQTWLALAGEVVIDYQLRLKSEYGSDKLVVLGYSNDVMGYIPSRRVQHEGGYEAGDSLMYFSQPGWFTDEVEDLVLRSARRVLAAVGVTMQVRPSSAQ